MTVEIFDIIIRERKTPRILLPLDMQYFNSIHRATGGGEVYFKTELYAFCFIKP